MSGCLHGCARRRLLPAPPRPPPHPQHFPVCVPESEDEVEELEERLPSPDAAAEDSAPFYDQAAW